MDIPALEAAVRSLEHSIGVFTWCLLGSTFVVSLGLILEYWHPVSEFIDELKWPMSVFRWPKFMEIAGGILVTIGVLGEFGFTLEVFVLEGRLEQANHAIRDTLTARLGEAGQMAKTAVSDASTALSQAKDALIKAEAAKASLGKTETEANNAQTASSNALTMAGQARREADSFEADIKSANEQAGEAESHLRDAMQLATEAQDELKRVTSRRTLSQWSKLIDALKPFKGSEYVFSSVAADREAIDFLNEIDKALTEAGWKRGASVSGFPGVNPRGKSEPNFSVPEGLTVGVHIAVDSPAESVIASMPITLWPRPVQAAVALDQVIFGNTFPVRRRSDFDPVELTTGKSETVRIDVGKKP
jgi:hypothetical protein